ncbi:MAG: T9SS type A sorting domain-containing protein [Saprospiraceae bacterium]|nr:T9SS type A sorting domain-containing protein [Saprospiraceae bacterium]
MQQTRFFFFFLFVLGLLNASATVSPNLQNRIDQEAPSKCNIPAPNNFHVIKMGVTDARLGWDFQPDATGGYRIRTYRSSDQLLINTTLKGQDQLEAIIDNLEPGTQYTFVINSICDGGGHSEKEANIDENTLIPELVVIGYQGSSANPLCTVPAGGGSCPFYFAPGLVNHFRIFRGDEVEEFGIEYVTMQNGLSALRVLVPLPPYRNTKYHFYCVDENGNGPSAYLPSNQGCGNAKLILVKFDGNSYLRFKVIGGASSTGMVEVYSFTSQCPVNPNNPNYDICRVEYQGFTYSNELQAPDPSYTGLRSGLANTPDFAAVAPNPFNDRLQVYVDDPTAESVHCQLFNVNGQKVLDQQFQGAQDTYELITENLANGFYLLRVEANGMVQTLRVIKAE